MQTSLISLQQTDFYVKHYQNDYACFYIQISIVKSTTKYSNKKVKAKKTVTNIAQ